MTTDQLTPQNQSEEILFAVQYTNTLFDAEDGNCSGEVIRKTAKQAKDEVKRLENKDHIKDIKVLEMDVDGNYLRDANI